MKDLIESYLSYCKNEKCLADKTLIYYSKALHDFSSWCQQTENNDLKQLTPSIIRQFLALQCGDKGKHTHRLVKVIYALRSFGKFLAREVRYDPFNLLEAPKQAHILPHILSQSEVERIIESAETPLEKMVIEILYSTGIRIGELCNLKVEDVNFNTKELKVVKGKGSKDGIVPIGKPALKALRRYLAAEKITLGPIMPSMDRGKLGCLIKRCAERAGITKRVYAHLFRHSCATHMLDNGAGIREVQEMLRHSSLSTTQIYTQVSMEKKLKECKKFWQAREEMDDDFSRRRERIEIGRCRPNLTAEPKRLSSPRLPKREKFIELFEKVREYAKDKKIIRSLSGHNNNTKRGALSIRGIVRDLSISYALAKKIREMIVDERNGKKVSFDGLNLSWKEDFIRAKIKEATGIILSEKKKLYPNKTVARAELHKYITMQELQDKLKVGYGYMYHNIWPELKKDNRLVDIELSRRRDNLGLTASHDGEPTKTSILKEAGIHHHERYEAKYSVGIVVHKTIDSLIADMIKVLGVDEQTARDTVADLIRNKDRLTVTV